jgi:hypothetical protein
MHYCVATMNRIWFSSDGLDTLTPRYVTTLWRAESGSCLAMPTQFGLPPLEKEGNAAEAAMPHPGIGFAEGERCRHTKWSSRLRRSGRENGRDAGEVILELLFKELQTPIVLEDKGSDVEISTLAG